MTIIFHTRDIPNAGENMIVIVVEYRIFNGDVYQSTKFYH